MAPTLVRSILVFLLIIFFSPLRSFGQTILQPGDLAVLGVIANNGDCGGESGEDLVAFVCFKDILPNTTIDLTDNGFARVNPGAGGILFRPESGGRE